MKFYVIPVGHDQKAKLMEEFDSYDAAVAYCDSQNKDESDSEVDWIAFSEYVAKQDFEECFND